MVPEIEVLEVYSCQDLHLNHLVKSSDCRQEKQILNHAATPCFLVDNNNNNKELQLPCYTVNKALNLLIFSFQALEKYLIKNKLNAN